MDKKYTIWPYKEAFKLEERLHQTRKDKLVLEMGIGASGIPHIGSVGDAIRVNFVKLAAKDIGYDSILIAFSDDKDGLRKVPLGFPKELEQYLGVPVSLIEDPFGCCESYAKHMNNFLVDTLTDLGISYEFKSSTEEYKKGIFNEQIKKIVSKKELVGKIIEEETSSIKKEDWYPIYVECSNCHNVYTTKISKLDLDKNLVTYDCIDEFKNKKGCGNSETTNFLNGKAKLTWKADWAARFDRYGVDFECYGKDLIEAFNASSRIVKEILNNPNPPNGVFYELFTTSDGAKISKSIGNSFTAKDWLKYASKDSLLLLMLNNPQRAKEASANVIPNYEKDYELLLYKVYKNDVYIEGDSTEALEFKLIKNLNPPEKKPLIYDFSSLCATIEILGEKGKIADLYLKRYFKKSFDDLIPIIEKGKMYTNDILKPLHNKENRYNKITVPNDALYELYDFFALEKTEREVQTKVFDLIKKYNLDKKDMFQSLYAIILKRDKGPKFTTLSAMLGNEEIRISLESVLTK
jgi:lysyl-tRNA synthetase class 1